MRPTLSIVFALVITMATATVSIAQDRQGNDTAGDWIGTHHKPFGLWDSVCDKRTTDGADTHRCYIRYVDVFSQRPKFGAVFAFVTPKPDGYHVEFGIEHGTRFNDNGFRIERNGASVWAFADACLNGGKCEIEGENAKTLIKELGARGQTTALKLEFVDRHGQPQKLSWDLSGFSAALADFEAELVKRSLRG